MRDYQKKFVYLNSPAQNWLESIFHAVIRSILYISFLVHFLPVAVYMINVYMKQEKFDTAACCGKTRITTLLCTKREVDRETVVRASIKYN